MFDISQFKFSENPYPHWFCVQGYSGVTVSIFGDVSGPDVRRVEVAQKVQSNLKRLEQTARKHLHDLFTVSSSENDWATVKITFGETVCDSTDEFAIYFNPGKSDIYGLYHVTFRSENIREQGQIFPHQIARENW